LTVHGLIAIKPAVSSGTGASGLKDRRASANRQPTTNVLQVASV
jgi:hypothetical protein